MAERRRLRAFPFLASILVASLLAFGLFSGATSAATPVNVAYGPASTRLRALAPFVVRAEPLRVFRGKVSALLMRNRPTRLVNGETITFTAGNTVLCTAITDRSGRASCDASAGAAAVIDAGGYTATFAGNATLSSSSADGRLIKIG